jgi:crotonobetainyl-CoA:carnitine CoA-transferase CaiB-like acyl-CoA transferase
MQRERFGGGQYIDLAMLDSALVFMASAAVPYLVTGQAMERTGNVGYSGLPTAAMFEAGDGHRISLGVVQPNQYEKLCKVLERPDLMADPRFATPDLQRKNADALRALLEEAFQTRSGAEWEALLSAQGVPCGLVRDIPGVFELDHLQDRELMFPVTIPGLPEREEVQVLGAGFKFAHDGPKVDQPPPRHGEHTGEVLAGLGYDAEAIRSLMSSGAAADH